MSSTVVYAYSHSVTYVADNILKSLKDILRLSGLDPTGLVDDWQSILLASTTWITSGHLSAVVLEIFNPKSDNLVFRWDIEIAYKWSDGGGSYWTDTEQLKFAIKKAGMAPSEARYRLLLDTKPGRPDVIGWRSAEYRSTAGMVRQSLGTTVEHSGLGARASYLRSA